MKNNPWGSMPEVSGKEVADSVEAILRRYAVFDGENLAEEKYVTATLWIMASHVHERDPSVHLARLEELIGPVNKKAKKVISKLAAERPSK
jgi:hypothetical protein